MAGLFLVNCLDAARSLGPDIGSATPELVRDFFLEEYLKPRGGGFNHDPAIDCTARIFDGSSSTEAAEKFCLTNGNPAGRTENAAIIRAVGPYASSCLSRVYRHGFLAVAVGRFKGRSIYVGLKAPFTRVCDGNAFVVLPGFRKTFVPSDQQLILPCSLAADQLAKGDYKEADVEYISAGPVPKSKDRVLKVTYGSRRKLLSADELDDVFNVYTRGIVMALEKGRGATPPDLAGYRIVDPDEPSLF